MKFSLSIVIALLYHQCKLSRKKTLAIISCLNKEEPLETIWYSIDYKAGQLLTAEEKQTINAAQEQWSVQKHIEYLKEKNLQLISYLDNEYPSQLKELKDFPVILYAQGDTSLLKLPMVAVVGSRKPTRYGQWATEKIVAELIDHHLVIVSGFMVGIDYFAHHVTGLYGGKSVGVLGFGHDHFYPQHLKSAAAEFIQQGNLLISEYPPSQPPHQGQFPARNRIVAGLSLATVVVEAQQKSGSLITAQFALDYNKLVAAVPGPIDSLYSQGTNHLIQEGALLVTSGAEVWAEIAINAVGS